MILSIILGIIVSLLFFYYVKERDILIIKNSLKPPTSSIKKDGKCYNIISEPTSCIVRD